MLTHLHIKNFAVIESLEIDLSPGLTAITGETGAGKSIMVDALGLALGDRADSGIVRDGAERADISATFKIGNNSSAVDWLHEQELSDEACILRRVINRDGRSKGYINGTPATMQQLRALGESLLDIHSQHEHQSLLQKNTHLRLLDEYAGAVALAGEVADSYKRCRTIQQQLGELRERSTTDFDQQQLFRYQLDELQELQIKENEFTELETELNRLSNAEEILSKGETIRQLCSTSDIDSHGCLEMIGQALKLCEDINDNQHVSESAELMESARIQMEEALHSLQQYLDSVEVNPERQQFVEQRLGDIYQVARKHKVQPTDLLDTQQELEQALSAFDNLEESLASCEENLAQAAAAYLQRADKLSAERQSASEAFDQEIGQQLALLGMNGTQFVTQLNRLTDDKLSARGAEEAEFLVSTNAGQIPRPLNKVASGGELSRISLAIQVISAQTSIIPTLVFDEVDVGIGGATAEVVGRLLRTLGDAGQVICVTHQPQVAAQAHQHLTASKTRSGATTQSSVTLLDEKERVNEIARMLGGIELTDTSREHAQEMLDTAQA